MDRLALKKLLILGALLVALMFVHTFFSKNRPHASAVSTAPVSTIVTSTSTVKDTPSTLGAPKTVKPSIVILPATIVQGDPILIQVSGVAGVKSLTYDGRSLEVFGYRSMPSAFVAIDLHGKTGSFPVTATLADGRKMTASVVVHARPKVEAPLGIPAALGDNTPAAATAVVSSLATDNATLATLQSTGTPLWSGAFHFPVANPIVTDVYGYTRDTQQYEIAHKGTDFKAPPGASVGAINAGKVIFVGDLGMYGNTIVVDHGGGVISFYMHLSEVDVTKGDLVARGQHIGLSGQTGYAEGPHLHLTIRIDGISIDPMVFLGFFK